MNKKLGRLLFVGLTGWIATWMALLAQAGSIWDQGGSFEASFNLASLNGTNGFAINGIDGYDRSGYSVSGAGDVNGDGLDDLLIGAYGANSSAGESYVVYGSPSGFPAALNLSSLNGTNGFVINGIDGSDRSGYSVSGAGDVNGDGLDDLLIGALGANSSAGESYVVYGSSSGFPAALNLSSLNGTNGFVINGIDGSDQSGYSVSGAGDVNGDGLDDLLIGALGANSSAGESYVVYGSSSGFPSALTLSSLNGTNGFVINGIDGNDQSGRSVSRAGDVNGDGLDDLLIGAYGANSSAGESYVVYGSSSGFPSALTLSSLNGTNGFVINGIDGYDRSGNSVSGAGDVNGDGLDDLLIGAYGANSSAGESYVVYGTTIGFPAALNLSSLNGTNGFVINGIDGNEYAGRSVSGAGDVNGDGLDDLLIGALGANSSAGESYVVYGSPSGFPSALTLSSSLNGTNGFVINGIDEYDQSGRSVSGAGDVNGDGLDDLLIGAPGANSSAGESYVIYGVRTASGVSPNSGFSAGGYTVTISGTDLGNGSDITNVTLNGIAVTSIDSQSATQIVVTAGAATSAGLGDVRVFSTSFGETVRASAFEYLRVEQAALTFEPSSPQAVASTNALSVTGGSGTGTVSYVVTSGPGTIVDGSNLTVTAGSGTIEIVATKAQDDWYFETSATGTVEALGIYAVSYDANGATSGSAPASQIKTNGVSLTLQMNSGNFVLPGYFFAGWNTTADGSGDNYAPGASYTENAATTLYAQWTENAMSPSGGRILTERRRTFKWPAVIGATWYQIWISRNGQKYQETWVEGAMTWTPPASGLPGGNYQWWVRGWGPDGYGPWSPEAAFTIEANVPGALTLIAPQGVQATHDLTYRWNKDENATWYQLWVSRTGVGAWHDRWFELSGTGEAAVNPGSAYPGVSKPVLTAPVGTIDNNIPTFLWAGGNCEWWVKSWGPDGTGPWSAPTSFTIPYAAGTWYQVFVNRGATTVIDLWTSSGSLLSPTLESGEYTWWLGVWDAAGNRTIWSDSMDFMVP